MNRKAVTPFQATIILSISLAVALIIAFWYNSIFAGCFKYEKFTIKNPVVEHLPYRGYFKIIIKVRNMGRDAITITDIRVNGKDYLVWNDTLSKAYYSYDEVTWKEFNVTEGIYVSPGQYVTVKLTLNDKKFSHGQLVEIVFVISTGMLYYVNVWLP